MTAVDTELDATTSWNVVATERPENAWRAVMRSLEGRIAVGFAAAAFAVVAFGELFAPYSPTQLETGPPLAGPSAAHLLGTDNFGRDVLSRFLAGGDTVILVPFAAVTLAYLCGGAAGIFAAYRGGRTDRILTRLFDVGLTLPPLLLVLVLIAGFGTGTGVLIVTVALVFGPRVARTVRGATQPIVVTDYVVAAHARGERTPYMLSREILPNAIAPVLADYALRLTYAIIFVATLSFLGLGAQPPSSDWGLMIAESRTFISINPWATIAPALGIAVLSVAFNLLADSLTRHLTRDPGLPPT